MSEVLQNWCKRQNLQYGKAQRKIYINEPNQKSFMMKKKKSTFSFLNTLWVDTDGVPQWIPDPEYHHKIDDHR